LDGIEIQEHLDNQNEVLISYKNETDYG